MLEFKRLRRNRKSPAIRSLLQETRLHPSDFIVPFFLLPGENQEQPIEFMPGISRLSLDLLLKQAESLHAEGIAAIALFPIVTPALRSDLAEEAYNDAGLIPHAIRVLKQKLPSLCIVTDVALDPYTTYCHDGIANEIGEIDNDATLKILAKVALSHARAGADIIAPSDMMDGRVKAIRTALNTEGFHHVNICSYAAKYASPLYSPFRNALSTVPAFGDKKTYQLNPANPRESLRDALTDEDEGADMLMVKPATHFLDILYRLREKTLLPLCAYHVGGEYAMVMAAHEKGYLDAPSIFYEALLSIKRAGADFIFTYAYPQIRNAIK